MPTSETIPVTVTPEAAARIKQLGVQAAVDRMIDYARRNLSEVERIEVVLYDRSERGIEPGLSIDVYSARPFDATEGPTRNMDRWVATEFPGEVLEHVLIDYHRGGAHAG